MSFYNRLLAQPIKTFVDLLGNTEPLDVVPMGGASFVTAVVAGSGNATLLPAASPGFAYRLHSLLFLQAAPTGPGPVYLQSGSARLVGAASAPNALYVALQGQIVPGPVTANNLYTSATQPALNYELVLAPTIQ